VVSVDIKTIEVVYVKTYCATHMRWHADAFTKDCVLRHPKDGEV